MKKILALLLALTMLLAFAACSKDDDTTQPTGGSDATDPSGKSGAATQTRMDKIKEAGVLVVGTSADYPPFEFHAEIDGVDTITGYDIMIAEELAKSLGVELEIKDMAFDGLLIGLQEDMFDIVLAGMSENPTRAEAADFSIETTSMDWAVVIRGDEEAEYNDWLEDFKESVIGVQSGTVYEDAAIKMTGEANVIKMATFQDLVIALKTGAIDAIVANEMTCRAYASGNDDLIAKKVGIVSNEPGQAAAVKKGQPEWLAYVSEQVQIMMDSGKLEQFLIESEKLADAAIEPEAE